MKNKKSTILPGVLPAISPPKRVIGELKVAFLSFKMRFSGIYPLFARPPVIYLYSAPIGERNEARKAASTTFHVSEDAPGMWNAKSPRVQFGFSENIRFAAE